MEVEYAKKLTGVLGIKWTQINLGKFHNFMDDWDKMYGVSTHAHGMYQIEFYYNVIKFIGKNRNLLSGVIGDAWSGNVQIGEINSVEDVVKLGYTHGISADKNSCLLTTNYPLRLDYFLKNKDKLKDVRIRIIESMRMKMVLLSYLTEVPRMLGFNVYSPFLDIEIACAMLNLNESRRKDRAWQVDFFKKHKVDFENQRVETDTSNTLDLQGMIDIPLMQLNTKLLSGIIRAEYIKSINTVIKFSSISLRFRQWLSRIFQYTRFSYITNAMKINVYNLNIPEAKAYAAYMIIKPIENILKKKYET